MTLCHTTRLQDNKMSVKNYRIHEGTIQLLIIGQIMTIIRRRTHLINSMTPFHTINENWTDDTDVKIAHEGVSRQVDRDKSKYNDRYVTHIQDGYTTVQIAPETCEMT